MPRMSRSIPLIPPQTGDAAITYEKIGTVDPKTGVVTLGEDGTVLEDAQYIVFYGEDGGVVGVSKLPAFTLKITADEGKIVGTPTKTSRFLTV